MLVRRRKRRRRMIHHRDRLRPPITKVKAAAKRMGKRSPRQKRRSDETSSSVIGKLLSSADNERRLGWHSYRPRLSISLMKMSGSLLLSCPRARRSHDSPPSLALLACSLRIYPLEASVAVELAP